jgi:hypothetical protein
LWRSLHRNINFYIRNCSRERIDTGGAASVMALVHLSGSEELVRLHFLDFVLNHNGFVDHVLEVSIIRVEQLELNVIIHRCIDVI